MPYTNENALCLTIILTPWEKLMKDALMGKVQEMDKYQGANINFIQDWCVSGKYIKLTILSGVIWSSMNMNTKLSTVESLLNMGADPRIKCQGFTSLEAAREMKMDEIADLLKKAQTELGMRDFELVDKSPLEIGEFENLDIEDNFYPVNPYSPTSGEKLVNAGITVSEITVVAVSATYGWLLS